MPKRYIGVLLLAALLIAWVAAITLVGPTVIIEYLGVRNGYLVALVVSAVGGFSLLTSGPLIATIAALAYAGLDPIVLGILSGIGMTIGDSVYFFIGIRGKAALEDSASGERRAKIEEWLRTRPKWMVPFVVYVYVGLTPLPNEALLLSLSVAGGKFSYVLPSLLLGNITLATAIALAGSQLLKDWAVMQSIAGLIIG